MFVNQKYTCARVSRVRVYILLTLLMFYAMNELLNVFSNLAFPVALVVVLLYAYRSIISKYISYLQSQNQKLTEIISRNNQLFEMIYNYLTKN